MTWCTADGSREVCHSSGALVFWLVLSLGLSACATTGYEYIQVPEAEMQAYLADKPPQLAPMYRNVLQQGPRNYVLNHMEAGLAAMELGAYPVAEESFEKALLAIETVFAENENAEKARSLWYEEGRKDFKGEPYERAMAYYYRGLLFLRRGDFENARACFKAGQLQDALAEDKKYQDDFALLMFLEGWASQQLGNRDMAMEAYDLARTIRPEFPQPAPEDNVLLIAETGLAPRKIAGGPGGSELRFERGVGFAEQRVRFLVEAMEVDAYRLEDIYWQASTRGGRAIDKILAGKVEFKELHGTVGQTLTDLAVVGMAASAQNRSTEGMIASGIVGVIGLLEQGLAANTQTRADDRYWHNLPDAVHVYTFHTDRRDVQVEARFYDAAGRELSDLRRSKWIEFTQNGSGFAWIRSRSAVPEEA